MLSSVSPIRYITALFFTILLSSCAGIGPRNLDRDQFDYTASIGRGWQSQILLNFVKLRYGDTPVFLEVTSIVNQYQLESEVGLKLINASLDRQELGAKGTYTDKPTISYNPIMGEKFTRSLLTPIPPETVFSLIQAGWPADLVLKMAVRSINGLRNTVGGLPGRRSADFRFGELVETVRRIQLEGDVGLRVKQNNNEEVSLLTFRSALTDQSEDDLTRVRELLDIELDQLEMPLVFGAVRQSKSELTVLTRSMLDVMSALSAYIDVPENHVAENRASPNLPDDSSNLIRVHSSAEQPLDAFVAVPYKNYWFWIADTDLESKHMLSVMVLLFSLVQTGNVSPVAPVLTIPAG
jgi:hypothetical protein